MSTDKVNRHNKKHKRHVKHLVKRHAAHEVPQEEHERPAHHVATHRAHHPGHVVAPTLPSMSLPKNEEQEERDDLFDELPAVTKPATANEPAEDKTVEEIEALNEPDDLEDLDDLEDGASLDAAEPAEPKVPELPDSREGLKPEQRAALLEVKVRAEETDRLVWRRAKPVLVAAIIVLFAGFYSLVAAIWKLSDPYVPLISLVVIGMATYLLYARDHHVAGTVLKVLVFALFVKALLDMFNNPAVVLLDGTVLMFLFIAYARVKALTYT